MIELKGTKKEQAVRQWFNDNHNGSVPTNAKVIDLFHKFKLDHPDISYGCLNGTMKKIVAEGHSQVTQEFHNSVAVEPVEPEVGFDDGVEINPDESPDERVVFLQHF